MACVSRCEYVCPEPIARQTRCERNAPETCSDRFASGTSLRTPFRRISPSQFDHRIYKSRGSENRDSFIFAHRLQPTAKADRERFRSTLQAALDRWVRASPSRDASKSRSSSPGTNDPDFQKDVHWQPLCPLSTVFNQAQKNLGSHTQHLRPN